MNTLSAYCILITSALVIDLIARWALHSPRHEHDMKPAGLVPLLFLCLLEKKRSYIKRSLIIKQYFLSLSIVIFMAGANYLLITLGAPKNADVLGYALLITPILTMPFFHFLYGLIGIEPLCIDDVLVDFRMRGAIAIILSANVIFIALEPLQHILGLAIHFCLAAVALTGSFFLCAHQRKKASVYHAPFQNIEYGLPSMMLHYLAAILEVFYFLVLTAEIFVKSVLEAWLAHPVDIFSFILTLAGLLAFVAVFTKIRFLFGAVISLEFYEQLALPLSFLIFGLASIIRYYL